MASALAGSGVRFGRAVLLVRGPTGVANAVNFYQNALGLTVVRHTDGWAELACAVGGGESTPSPEGGAGASGTGDAIGGKFRLSIRAVESEAHLSSGYTPLLSFDVDDMDSVVARCAQLGGSLDGPIQFPAHGKVAALRAPDGHMIGLYEPAV